MKVIKFNYIISSVFCMLFTTVPTGQSQVLSTRETSQEAENKNEYKNMEIPITYIKIELFPNIPVESYPRELYNKSDIKKGMINLFNYLTNKPPFPLQSFDAILIPFVQGEQFMAAMDSLPYTSSVMGLRFRKIAVNGNHISVVLPDGDKVSINHMYFIINKQLSACKTVADVYKSTLDISGKKVPISDIGTVMIDGINYMDACGISYR